MILRIPKSEHTSLSTNLLLYTCSIQTLKTNSFLLYTCHILNIQAFIIVEFESYKVYCIILVFLYQSLCLCFHFVLFPSSTLYQIVFWYLISKKLYFASHQTTYQASHKAAGIIIILQILSFVYLAIWISVACEKNKNKRALPLFNIKIILINL